GGRRPLDRAGSTAGGRRPPRGRRAEGGAARTTRAQRRGVMGSIRGREPAVSAADQPVGPPGGGASPALFARRRGEGRPLVLLHGLLVSGELFAPVLDALAARHHLIVPDLRGHGRSAHLPGPDTVEQLADDIA